MRAPVCHAAWLTLAVLVAGCGGGGSSSADSARPTISVSAAPVRFDVSANAGETPRPQTTTLSIQNAAAAPVFLSYTVAGEVIDTISFLAVAPESKTIEVFFQPGLQPGQYDDELEIAVCLDSACRQHVQGSPLRFAVSLTVTGENIVVPSEWPTLPVLGQVELGHDVVAAAYNRSYEALVMVSTTPANALHIYRPLTGERFEQPLPEAPTALAVSPDGRAVAIGHDSSISHVRLDSLVAGGDAQPLRLDVSAPIGALELSNSGTIYAIPRDGVAARLLTILVESNRERTDGIPVRAGSRMLTARQQSAFYLVPRGVTPGDLEKLILTAGLVLDSRFPPVRGLHDTCEDLWTNERGTTLYTACGNTFRASRDVDVDMTYSGRLQLSFAAPHARIHSLSQSEVLQEILLVESDGLRCEQAQTEAEPCRTRLAVYESEFMNRSDVYEIPQQALFVFHGGDGQRAYLVGRVVDESGERFIVSVVR